MKAFRWKVSPLNFSVAAGLILAVTLAGAILGQGQGTTAAKQGTVEHIKVHGKALEGNLENDSPDRDVFVYLPPSYSTETARRYPVVYMLHGYGISAQTWMNFSKIADAANKDIEAGTMKEMILVNPDANTLYNGSMYSSSATIGDWETYIAEDLVGYVDSHYRTLANRDSRGLGGHSMGGYGTIRIGMKRPDVFSSLYIMSACCLLNQPSLTRGGGGAARGAATGAAPGAASDANATQNTPSNPPAGQGTPAQAAGGGAPGDSAVNPAAGGPNDGQAAAAAGGAGQRGGGAGGRGGNRGGAGGRGNAFANTAFAEAAAWSANPGNPPKFYDEPVKDGQLQPLIVAKWLANSPLAMIDQYATNLKKYKAIAHDVGTQDSLMASNKQMEERMTALGIRHNFETYDGDHMNRLAQRIEQDVMPFFSNNLSFGLAGK